MSCNISDAVNGFVSWFGNPPALAARAPGRVNIIGEHTDYNDGFVLPMAIEHDTVIVGNPRNDNLLRLRAETLNRSAEVSLADRTRNNAEPWTDYIMGVADEIIKAGKPIRGADMLIMGDVPVGCGLSSSAALEMAALAFFEQAGSFRLDDTEAARLGQRVENNFLGLSSGIMDQFISRCAKENHALFLDCRTYWYEMISVNFDNALFVIANTACPRGLTSSKYNERVQECKQAVEALNKLCNKNGEKLRDFVLEDLVGIQEYCEDIPFRRARHVISENARTLAACEAMRQGDVNALGKLMNESDKSLQVDYEVTSRELDIMTALARTLPGCYGARMTGAGFGGCTVNLVRRDAVEHFCNVLMARYKEETGITGEVYVSSPASGAGPVAVYQP